MKIKIIAVGKIKEKYLKIGINDYINRIKPYINLEIIEVQDEKAPETYSDSQIDNIKKIEGEKIIRKINNNDYVIALVIEGENFSSEEFANFIARHMIYDRRNIVFIIGGSNGLSKNVLKRSNKLLSFSKFTFPHQLMRLILLEQIYRSYKIIRNETYHK